MDTVNYQSFNQIERELIALLKEEFSFYQSLYIMLDRQRELIRFEKDENLLDLFAEIERGKQRILHSEERIAGLKAAHSKLFDMVIQMPEVKKLINSIATLVKKNLNLVTESELFMKERYQRLKSELGELQHSRQMLQYYKSDEPDALFVDGKN